MGSDISSKTKNGMSCLHIAAMNGNLNICKALLNNYNFDSRIKDFEGGTALHSAAQNGDLEVFKYLLKDGCDVYGKKEDNTTCLHIAALNGHLNLCKMLLDNYNFDVKMKSHDEETALHCAAHSGDVELFQCLVEKGSDAYSKKKDNLSCFQIAASHGHLNLCKMLLENYNFDVAMKGSDRWNELYNAVLTDDVELFTTYYNKLS